MKMTVMYLSIGAVVGAMAGYVFKPMPKPVVVEPVKVEAPPPVGRYQIVYGKIERLEIGPNSTRAEVPVIIKLDTATGETSRYTEMFVKRPGDGETVQIARFEKLQKVVTIREPEEQGKIAR
jgi:hypothetical protein